MLDNWRDTFRILRGNSTTSDNSVASWNLGSRQFSLSAYTSPSSFPGTAAANLAIDSSGNVITIAPGTTVSASYAVTASVAYSGTGSFTGSFIGVHTGSLFGTASQAISASYVPASGVVGLNLSQIVTGSVTASVGQSSSSFQVTSGSNTLMILNNSGSLTIGSSPASQLVLRVSRNITGNAISRGVIVDGQIQSDVTNAAHMFSTSPNTAAAAFTLPTIYNYYASGVSTGSSSAVTAQYGFYAESNMINATNNYGFYGNIPSGSNRYNLYMGGNAVNYLAGRLGIGNTAPAYDLDVFSSTANVAIVANTNNNSFAATVSSWNSAYGNAIQMRSYGNATGATIFGISTNGMNSLWSNGDTIYTIGTVGATPMVFGTNNTERMRILSGGNVGINTTTPTTTLDVSGSGRFTNGANVTGSVQITGSLGVTGSITSTGNITTSGTITAQTLVVTTISSSVEYSSGSNIFGNSTANTQTMTGSLNVSGSATIIGRVTATDITGSLFGTASQALTASYVAASGVVGLNLSQIATGSVTASVGQTSASFQIVSGSTNFLFVSNSGNIGIGTTSPSTRLDVRTDTGVLIKGATSNSDAILSFLPTTGGRQYDFRNFGSSFGIVDSSANITRMYFNFSGNTGIGLTNPSALLHVSGSGSGSLMQISSHVSSSIFFVSGSGNVGIGTITPEFKLDISGSGQARIGAAELGNWPSVTNYAFFGHERLDHTAAGNYALLQDQGGNTYANAANGRTLYLRINNNTRATVEDTKTTITGSAQITGSLGVTGSLSVTASVGTSVFSSNADTLLITGSLIITGSGATITGSLNVSNGITGSLFGTASQALTASYVPASGVVGLNLSQIATGSVTASVGQSTASFQVVSGSNTLLYLSNSGSLGLATTNVASTNLRLSKNMTGGTTAYGVLVEGTIQSDVTTNAFNFLSAPTTVAASFALNALHHFNASQNAGFGAGSSVNSQYGFFADSSLNAATNNYGFYGAIARAANRYNLFMNGTADNYLAGNTGIGKLPSSTLDVSGSALITGSLNISGSITTTGTITAQTLVVQTITSSIEYSSGSNIFGSQITDRQTMTGSVNMTGSLNLYGNQNITGSLNVSGALTLASASLNYQHNLSVTAGGYQVIVSAATGSYRCAFFDYVMFSGSIVRAGTVTSTWSGSATEYNETYTNDLGGSTSGVQLQTVISTGNIQLQATASSQAWTIRSLIRLL